MARYLLVEYIEVNSTIYFHCCPINYEENRLKALVEQTLAALAAIRDMDWQALAMTRRKSIHAGLRPHPCG